MRKRAIVEKDRRPAMVAGVLVLLAVVLAVVVIKNQFQEKSGESTQAGGEKEVQTNAVAGAGRKNIYDRNFMELAVSFQRSSLYARPLELEQPETVAREVAKILALDEKIILSSLKGERSFTWLGKDLSRERAAKIADLNLKGVYCINQVQRFYPGNQLAAHVLGFLKDEQGLAGVEFYYDSVMRGGGGYEPRLVAAGVSKKIVEGSDSASLILTLDIHVQNILEQKLKGLLASTGSKAGAAVVMAPNTGEIIGLVSLPDYDPNQFWNFSAEVHRNRATENILDLGAMDRLFQVAAVMENSISQKNVTSETEAGMELEVTQKMAWNMVQNGRYISAEGVDFGRGLQGQADSKAFAERIGLTAKGEVDLPEALFALKNGHSGLDTQGPAVSGRNTLSSTPAMLLSTNKDFAATATPLALLSAFCRLINGGQSMTPHVLRAVWQGEQLWTVPARQGVGEFGVRPELSAAMRGEMKKAAGAGKSHFIIESLRQKDLAPQGQVKTTGIKGVQVGQGQEGGAKAAPAQLGVESILLGMLPLEHPEIALVVVLEEAHIDPLAKSPMRDIAEEIMAQARIALQSKARVPTAKELAVRENGFYKKMAMTQVQAALPVALNQETQRLIMPDVLGLSGRKALQVLQPYGIRLQIAGSGQVSRQYPLAGTVLRGVEHGVLHLKTMQ